MKLVLVGKAFTDTTIPETMEVNRLIESLGLGGSVVRPGFLSEEQLSTFYTHAACLVLPSHYEGFGLPVLEAMTSGCPVVAAHNSSLMEISGPAVRVESESPKSIAEGIDEVISLNVGERKKLIDDGYAWAASYTWAATAKKTVEAYERALS